MNLMPFPSEPARILNMQKQHWRNRDFEFFLWQKLDNILIFDTATYAVQSKFFKKLAFYTEKLGYTGNVYPDYLLADKHGYNAHNYAAKDLAGYFNKATKTSLNTYELHLIDILIANRIIIYTDNIFYPVTGGVISISRESTNSLRAHLLVHELFHGIFYNFPRYQDGVYRIWRKLSNMEKEFWFLFFWSNGYSTQDPDIVINEFHAYLLQQSEENISGLLYNKGLEDIKQSFPHKKYFIDNFTRSCKNCLLYSARDLAALLFSIGQEAGFDYLTYLNTIKPY